VIFPSERLELIGSAAKDVEVDRALDAVDMPGIVVLPQLAEKEPRRVTC
jgi:hypothetical protein